MFLLKSMTKLEDLTVVKMMNHIFATKVKS
jgi:hypothetical protein